MNEDKLAVAKAFSFVAVSWILCALFLQIEQPTITGLVQISSSKATPKVFQEIANAFAKNPGLEKYFTNAYDKYPELKPYRDQKLLERIMMVETGGKNEPGDCTQTLQSKVCRSFGVMQILITENAYIKEYKNGKQVYYTPEELKQDANNVDAAAQKVVKILNDPEVKKETDTNLIMQTVVLNYNKGKVTDPDDVEKYDASKIYPTQPLWYAELLMASRLVNSGFWDQGPKSSPIEGPDLLLPSRVTIAQAFNSVANPKDVKQFENYLKTVWNYNDAEISQILKNPQAIARFQNFMGMTDPNGQINSINSIASTKLTNDVKKNEEAARKAADSAKAMLKQTEADEQALSRKLELIKKFNLYCDENSCGSISDTIAGRKGYYILENDGGLVYICESGCFFKRYYLPPNKPISDVGVSWIGSLPVDNELMLKQDAERQVLTDALSPQIVHLTAQPKPVYKEGKPEGTQYIALLSGKSWAYYKTVNGKLQVWDEESNSWIDSGLFQTEGQFLTETTLVSETSVEYYDFNPAKDSARNVLSFINVPQEYNYKYVYQDGVEYSIGYAKSCGGKVCVWDPVTSTYDEKNGYSIEQFDKFRQLRSFGVTLDNPGDLDKYDLDWGKRTFFSDRFGFKWGVTKTEEGNLVVVDADGSPVELPKTADYWLAKVREDAKSSQGTIQPITKSDIPLGTQFTALIDGKTWAFYKEGGGTLQVWNEDTGTWTDSLYFKTKEDFLSTTTEQNEQNGEFAYYEYNVPVLVKEEAQKKASLFDPELAGVGLANVITLPEPEPSPLTLQEMKLIGLGFQKVIDNVLINPQEDPQGLNYLEYDPEWEGFYYYSYDQSGELDAIYYNTDFEDGIIVLAGKNVLNPDDWKLLTPPEKIEEPKQTAETFTVAESSDLAKGVMELSILEDGGVRICFPDYCLEPPILYDWDKKELEEYLGHYYTRMIDEKSENAVYIPLTGMGLASAVTEIIPPDDAVDLAMGRIYSIINNDGSTTFVTFDGGEKMWDTSKRQWVAVENPMTKEEFRENFQDYFTSPDGTAFYRSPVSTETNKPETYIVQYGNELVTYFWDGNQLQCIGIACESQNTYWNSKKDIEDWLDLNTKSSIIDENGNLFYTYTGPKSLGEPTLEPNKGPVLLARDTGLKEDITPYLDENGKATTRAIGATSGKQYERLDEKTWVQFNAEPGAKPQVYVNGQYFDYELRNGQKYIIDGKTEWTWEEFKTWMNIGQTYNEAVEAATAGRSLSTLLGFSDNSWRRMMDSFFVHTVLGSVISGNWEESVCHSYIDRPPEGTMYLIVPDGANMVGVGAHIEAEREDLKFVNATGPQGEFFYSISIYVKNPEKPSTSGQAPVQDMIFNVVLSGQRTKVLFKTDQTVKPGQSFIRTGSKMITQFSSTKYNKICIEFKKPVFTASGTSATEVCNTITTYKGPGTKYTEKTTTTTSSGGQQTTVVNTI